MWRSQIFLSQIEQSIYRSSSKQRSQKSAEEISKSETPKGESEIPKVETTLTTYNILLDGLESDMEEIDENKQRVIPWSQRLPFIVKTISKLRSSIFCFQEINEKMKKDIVTKIGDSNYTVVLGTKGRSINTNMQCAIMYDTTIFKHIPFELKYGKIKFSGDSFEPENIHKSMHGWRMLVCKLQHISGTTICIASVHAAAGEKEGDEDFRAGQFEDLMRFSEQIDADFHIVCGDFNSDPKLTLYDEDEKPYKLTKVYEFFRRKNYENISGSLKTYHGWTKATFDFVYAKAKRGKNLKVLNSSVNFNTKRMNQNIPSVTLEEGSDHAALTVRFQMF